MLVPVLYLQNPWTPAPVTVPLQGDRWWRRRRVPEDLLKATKQYLDVKVSARPET